MIACIMVLYNPNENYLQNAINSILPQVDQLILVDNSSFINKVEQNTKVHYIPLRKNLGIAKAQNIGFNFINENLNQIKYIVFSDQDSVVRDNVVLELVNGFEFLYNKNFKVGIVGTRAINERNNKRYKSNAKELKFYSKEELDFSTDITEVVSVRSSVSLISVDVFREIGGFDEDLFIDGVDHEWCWRAAFSGKYKSFIIENAIIDHNLGEGDKTIGFYRFSFPSSIRLYYQYRNYLFLIRRNYVPKHWKFKHFFKYFFKFFYFSLIHENKKQNFYNILRGIKDGLIIKVNK